jgi:energy-coupling factor transport system ATP-binding protein
VTEAGAGGPGTVAVGPPSVEAADLGWTYAGRSRPAIEGLTFRLQAGHVLLVLGPSGSGKSTLARALAGLVPNVLPGRWQGSLRVGELEVSETPARLLGERIGLVFQDPDSQLVMTRVDDEVAFGLENHGWPRSRMVSGVPAALAQVGLAGFEARSTVTLSGGEKQRLAIADVLAARPGMLILDEPTANLDPPGMHAIFEHLAALARRREHTIVLIEHRLEAALPLADDVLLIGYEGRQLAFAPAGDVGRSGAWVPRAWQVTRQAGDRAVGAIDPGVESVEPVEPVEPAVDAAAEAAASDRRAVGGGALLLEAADMRVEYGADDGGKRIALDGVSVSVRAGERVALVGPNGAGKSSLLFALAGLLRPAAGTVRLRALPPNGEPAEPLRDPSRLSSNEIAARIGIVFQDPELGFVAGTARDEVSATARAMGGRRGPATGQAEDVEADRVLSRFGLGRLALEIPFRLSQGEQRRLSLAALALRPPAVLLLDEPTFGLDRRGTEAVLALLDDRRDLGQAQVLATHDPRLLPACDRVVALDRGRVIFDGRPEAFLAAPPYVPPGPWRDGIVGGPPVESRPGAR